VSTAEERAVKRFAKERDDFERRALGLPPARPAPGHFEGEGRDRVFVLHGPASVSVSPTLDMDRVAERLIDAGYGPNINKWSHQNEWEAFTQALAYATETVDKNS
jgi:hypothetical protein